MFMLSALGKLIWPPAERPVDSGLKNQIDPRMSFVI